MKPRKIEIRTVLNGWIATVGCQEVVFTDLTVMLKDLESYMSNPSMAELAYQENAVNARFFNFAEAMENEPGAVRESR